MDKKIDEMDQKPAITVNERPEFMEPAVSPKKVQQPSVSKPVKLKTE